MIIKQLSVFLENKYGRLTEILDIIGKADIRIIAASVADTSEYGILRIISTNTALAYKLLKEHNVNANLSDVIAISCDSSANEFSKQFEYFKKGGISIEYMYCFSVKDKAFLILRTNDYENSMKVIRENGLCSVSEAELINM